MNHMFTPVYRALWWEMCIMSCTWSSWPTSKRLWTSMVWWPSIMRSGRWLLHQFLVFPFQLTVSWNEYHVWAYHCFSLGDGLLLLYWLIQKQPLRSESSRSTWVIYLLMWNWCPWSWMGRRYQHWLPHRWGTPSPESQKAKIPLHTWLGCHLMTNSLWSRWGLFSRSRLFVMHSQSSCCFFMHSCVSRLKYNGL